MRVFILICCMTLTCTLQVKAEEADSIEINNVDETIYIEKQDSVLRKWGPVINAIATLESRKNPNVVSRCGNYVGYLQISKVLVNECNMIIGEKRYAYNDRLDKDKSIEMFIVIQNQYNPEGSIEKAIRLWKSGDVRCMERKHRTESYYQRIMQIYSEDNWEV